jgi:hypothetical protein
VPTAGEPQVFPGDANPFEVLRGDKHPLDELAVLVLDPLSLHQGVPRLRRAIGEPIPNRLQLAEIERPRRGGDGLDAVRDLRVPKPLADKTGELCLEAGDLPAQLQPRLALVDRTIQPSEFLLSQ